MATRRLPTTPLLALLALTLASCMTSLSPRGAAVREADEAMVKSCELVGTFNGTSGWGGSGATAVGANNAKNAVFERAARAGATHVVFTELSGGMFTKATGRAYKCPPSPPAD